MFEFFLKKVHTMESWKLVSLLSMMSSQTSSMVFGISLVVFEKIQFKKILRLKMAIFGPKKFLNWIFSKTKKDIPKTILEVWDDIMESNHAKFQLSTECTFSRKNSNMFLRYSHFLSKMTRKIDIMRFFEKRVS